MAGRRQMPFMSNKSRSGHKPLIPIPASSDGLIFAFAVNCDRSRQKSPHQISSASCSVHPGLGMLIPCSIDSTALTRPSVQIITPFEPEVPISTPKRYEVLMIHLPKIIVFSRIRKKGGEPAGYLPRFSAGLPGLRRARSITRLYFSLYFPVLVKRGFSRSRNICFGNQRRIQIDYRHSTCHFERIQPFNNNIVYYFHSLFRIFLKRLSHGGHKRTAPSNHVISLVGSVNSNNKDIILRVSRRFNSQCRSGG